MLTTIMKIDVLLGGKTRFTILEALAEVKKPVTAYQIAVTRGLDPAATYRCLIEFSEFGVVEYERKERNQTFYKLSKRSGKAAAEYLLSLKQKAAESIDLEKWSSPEMQAERMAKIVRFDTTTSFGKAIERKGVDELLSKRVSGELSALIASSKIAFNELFEQKNDDTFTLRT
jgi:Fe2+ or Zn2+ uptake regulation protein